MPDPNRTPPQPQGDPETDEAILDFLVYDAINILLADAQENGISGPKEGEDEGEEWAGMRLLEMVDSFLAIFKTLHPKHICSEDTQLRMRLLQFTVLFTLRYKGGRGSRLKAWLPELKELRIQRRKETEIFIKHTGARFPDLGTANTTTSTDRLDKRDQDPPPLVGLADILPFFMSLSAAQNALQAGSQVTTRWMRLAAGFMAHAVMEQYLVHGSSHKAVVENAFAWGFDAKATYKEGSDAFVVNAMFLDEEDEFKEWAEIKEHHLDALKPPQGQDLADHLRKAREDELPVEDFNRLILGFADGLSRNIARPVLSGS